MILKYRVHFLLTIYTSAGTYPITVSAVETDNYLAVSQEVALIIENANLGGITFDNGVFIYDGTEHSIFVAGAPDDATVTYTGNGQVLAGIYVVTALVQMENYDLVLEAMLTIELGELVIPNVFTPVGDGLNDVFKIDGHENYSRVEVVIFNHWGSEVFRNPNYRNEWNGVGLSDGTYYYMVTTYRGNVVNVYKGNVLIKRN